VYICCLLSLFLTTIPVNFNCRSGAGTFSTPKWLDALTKSLVRHTPIKIRRQVNNPYRIIIYNFGKYYGKLKSIGDATILKKSISKSILLAY